MAPPAKRRKRNVVESEDEEDTAHSRKNSLKNFLFSSPDKRTTTAASPAASPSPVKKATRATAADRSTNGGRALPKRTSTNSPAATPEKKGKSQKKAKIEEKGKSGDLLALFSKQAQKSQILAATNGKKQVDVIAVEDIISDPISEDDEVGEHKVAASSLVGKNAQRRFKGSSQSASSSFSTTSQRFLKPPQLPAVSSVDDDLRPWSERFGPCNLEELAVHKKKVADVRKWLDDAMSGRIRQRLLILKGAAGTAKTTTMQLLAKDMNFEILEWRNPAGSLGATHGFSSASAQFQEFMNRGGTFGQLEMESDSPPILGTSNGSFVNGAGDDHHQKVILIEEFPNTFMRSSSALTSFRSTIVQYLRANTPALAGFNSQSSNDSIIPIVMIVSETLLTTTSASADSFTAHRLLGPEILHHPGTWVIEFNAIAPTILAKALELVVQKEARKSGRRKTPGPPVLRRLGEIGDIRNAVASLEFLCLKGDDDADWGAKVVFTKPKKGSKDVAMTKHEQQSLELISQREASLGIFHAVGKVVYNKREELSYPAGSVEAQTESLPSYLSEYSRAKKSQVLVDTLIDEIGTDTSTFISALHENYILSCERTGPGDLNSSLDYIDGCIEYLSEGDLLFPSWDNFFGGKGFSGGFGRDSGSHILRQDEIAFQVAVRGLLFSLPSPVKRMSTGSARGGDQFKMFYPTSIKLWKDKEEMEGQIDMWASNMLKGEMTKSASAQPSQNITNGASAFRKTKPSSVGDSATNRTELAYAARMAAKKGEATSNEEQTAPLLSLGSSARKEMLLERLPYMAHISRRKKGAFFSTEMKSLEKIVSFHGSKAPVTEDASEEEDDNGGTAAEAWATDKPTEEASPRKRKVGAIRTKNDESEEAIPGGVQSLVLSDDDIEDD